jgi:hypothetical protein
LLGNSGLSAGSASEGAVGKLRVTGLSTKDIGRSFRLLGTEVFVEADAFDDAFRRCAFSANSRIFMSYVILTLP